MLVIDSLSPSLPQSSSIFSRIPKFNHRLLRRPADLHFARTLNSGIRRRTRFLRFAGNGISNGGEEGNLRKGSNGGGEGGGDSRNDRRPLFNLKLGDLLDPDPENVVAVGLTCVLTWASVQVLWQLFFVSLAVLVAALKYSFIAVLLIFILIALL